MSFTQNEIISYLQKTKRILFSSRRDEGTDIRILGGFATDELTTYFLTAKDAHKVHQIEEHPESSAYFEAPDQEFPNYVNITIYGKTSVVTDPSEVAKAAALIHEKVPHLNYDAEKQVILVLKASELKIFNSAAELAQDKVQVVVVD